jgi:hypothetical protein
MWCDEVRFTLSGDDFDPFSRNTVRFHDLTRQ